MDTAFKEKSSFDSTIWKKNEGAFSTDSAVDIFLKDRDSARNENFKPMLLQIRKNLMEAGLATAILLKKISLLFVGVKAIYLKADNIYTFTVLLVVDENDYLNDQFRSVFTESRDIREQFLKNTFYISFTFLPASTKFNETNLIADGYSWTYAKY